MEGLISKSSLMMTKKEHTLDPMGVLSQPYAPVPPLIWCLMGRKKDQVEVPMLLNVQGSALLSVCRDAILSMEGERGGGGQKHRRSRPCWRTPQQSGIK